MERAQRFVGVRSGAISASGTSAVALALAFESFGRLEKYRRHTLERNPPSTNVSIAHLSNRSIFV